MFKNLFLSERFIFLWKYVLSIRDIKQIEEREKGKWYYVVIIRGEMKARGGDYCSCASLGDTRVFLEIFFTRGLKWSPNINEWSLYSRRI